MRTGGKRWAAAAAAVIAAGAAAPTVARWVRGAGAARRAVDLRTTIVVERPVAEVFAFCRDFENFPRITDLLLSVEDSQDGRSHWAVRSPRGRTVGWDAVVSKYVPNSVIAWESVPGSAVAATGLMRFAPLSERETRVDLRLTYRPRRTDFLEALRALVHPANTDRLRVELAQAARELGERLAARDTVMDQPFRETAHVERETTIPLQFDRPSDATRDAAPQSDRGAAARLTDAPRAAGTPVDRDTSP